MQTLLAAESPGVLKHALSLLDIGNTHRAQGQNKHQKERYYIAHLLHSIPRDYIEFPLTLEQAERPDFELRMPSITIGIEVTEAVPENQARAKALRKKGFGKSVHFLKRAQPGEVPKSTKDLRAEIISDCAEEPWIGNEPEAKWAEAMLHISASKVAKAYKPGFRRHATNWLLIYDNWPIPDQRHAEANTLLASHCNKAGLHATFHRIFALDHKFVCEASANPILHPVLNPFKKLQN
ncbi:MAG: hypothetical protein KGL18_14135 [Burkholderiales bacterium]|nr:hypothetical protein [Burkholderiales bacterium]MDE1926726.1 hypothetical protein [Burkholderiales bacterium]MDE2504098.1 hypothetical protein [Burkholderiales bacterium]